MAGPFLDLENIYSCCLLYLIASKCEGGSNENLRSPFFFCGPQISEQEGMVTWFDADDVTRFRLQKIVEVGGIGTQAVFEDNNWTFANLKLALEK